MKNNRKFQEYMDAYEQNWPLHGAYLVARDGEILFQKGYGMANFEHAVPNMIDTRFLIGSITKSFTAVAIMMLVEAGEIQLSDSLSVFFSDYPEVGKKITIHHLLTHTSGIPQYTLLPGYLQKKERLYLTQEELIDFFKDEPLDFEPGEECDYSNSNYYLLGVIIEKISGQSYADFLQEKMFGPLKMTNTGLYHQRNIVPRRASNYELRGDSYVNGDFAEMANPFAAGALYSTLGDLFIWVQALFAKKLVSEESLEKMFTPVKKIDRTVPYGYGFYITEIFGRKRVGHEGGLHGYLSQLYHYPKDNVTVIILANAIQNIWKLGDVLAAIAFDEEYEISQLNPVQVSPELLQQYEGVYGQNGYGVSIKDDQLYFSFPKTEKAFRMIPVTETKFVNRMIEEYIEFVRDDGEQEFELKFYGVRLKKNS